MFALEQVSAYARECLSEEGDAGEGGLRARTHGVESAMSKLCRDIGLFRPDQHFHVVSHAVSKAQMRVNRTASQNLPLSLHWALFNAEPVEGARPAQPAYADPFVAQAMNYKCLCCPRGLRNHVEIDCFWRADGRRGSNSWKQLGLHNPGVGGFVFRTRCPLQCRQLRDANHPELSNQPEYLKSVTSEGKQVVDESRWPLVVVNSCRLCPEKPMDSVWVDEVQTSQWQCYSLRDLLTIASLNGVLVGIAHLQAPVGSTRAEHSTMRAKQRLLVIERLTIELGPGTLGPAGASAEVAARLLSQKIA
jgi:hypothetical protein